MDELPGARVVKSRADARSRRRDRVGHTVPVGIVRLAEPDDRVLIERLHFRREVRVGALRAAGANHQHDESEQDQGELTVEHVPDTFHWM